MEPYTLILLCILVMAYILIRLENRRDFGNGKSPAAAELRRHSPARKPGLRRN